MDRQEAERQCETLMREHPDRDSYNWIPRQVGGDEWEIVKVKVPEGLRRNPIKATVEAKPKPPQPDDPRPLRDSGGPWVA